MEKWEDQVRDEEENRVGEKAAESQRKEVVREKSVDLERPKESVVDREKSVDQRRPLLRNTKPIVLQSVRKLARESDLYFLNGSGRT